MTRLHPPSKGKLATVGTTKRQTSVIFSQQPDGWFTNFTRDAQRTSPNPGKVKVSYTLGMKRNSATQLTPNGRTSRSVQSPAHAQHNKPIWCLWKCIDWHAACAVDFGILPLIEAAFAVSDTSRHEHYYYFLLSVPFDAPSPFLPTQKKKVFLCMKQRTNIQAPLHMCCDVSAKGATELNRSLGENH